MTTTVSWWRSGAVTAVLLALIGFSPAPIDAAGQTRRLDHAPECGKSEGLGRSWNLKSSTPALSIALRNARLACVLKQREKLSKQEEKELPFESVEWKCMSTMIRASRKSETNALWHGCVQLSRSTSWARQPRPETPRWNRPGTLFFEQLSRIGARC
jgi:hypothetical protein